MNDYEDEQNEIDSVSIEGSNRCTDENDGIQDRDIAKGQKEKNSRDRSKDKKRTKSETDTKDGKVESAKPIGASTILQNYNSKHSIRDIHFSKDSRYLIYCNDNGLIFLWSIVLTSAKSSANSSSD